MTSAAFSVVRFVKFFQRKQLHSVLDYGAGTLRNSGFLADSGFEVYAADQPAQVERIMAMAGHRKLAGILAVDELEQGQLKVDLVLSNYVLNIIPDGSEKNRYLKNIYLNLRPEGYLLVEVRCPEPHDICERGRGGYRGCPACPKTYTHTQLNDLLAPYGFKHICHYYRHHSVAVLYQVVST